MTTATSDSGCIRVEWVFCDEGWWGDYDPTNPDDQALMRFDTYVKIADGWAEFEDGSYCTQTPYDTDPETLTRMAQMMANVIAANPGKRTCEMLSWVHPGWLVAA